MAPDITQRVIEAAQRTNALLDEVSLAIRHFEALQREVAMRLSELDDLVSEARGTPKARAH